MKKSILLLSLCLMGNVAHAGIASKLFISATMLSPAIFFEFARYNEAKYGSSPEAQALAFTMFPVSSSDARPWKKETNIHIDPKITDPNVREVLKIKEQTYIDNNFKRKVTTLLSVSPALSLIAMSPLKKIPHPVAKVVGFAGTVGLCVGSSICGITKLLYNQEKLANRAITDPHKARAFLKFCSSEKEKAAMNGNKISEAFYSTYERGISERLNEMKQF